MALNLSIQDISIPINDSVYKSLKTDFTYKSLKDLKELDEGLKPIVLSERVQKAQTHLKTIYFRDPLTQELTQSALSEENILRLKQNFGNEGFYQRKDGSYILSAEVEKFVAGWYGDIAYQRAYLSADKNQDGFMDKAELDETRSGFATHGYAMVVGNKVIRSENSYVESYIKMNGYALSPDAFLEKFTDFQKSLYNQGKFAENTIALELDKTIKNDKDFNSTIEYKEILSTEEMLQAAKDGIEYVIGTNGLGAGFFDDSEFYTLLDLMIEDEDILKIFNKLELNEFNSNKLDKKELENLQKNFKEFFDENGVLKKEEFQRFYEGFKQEFINKSLTFLNKEKGLDLDYEKLSTIMLEIGRNYKETNVSKVNFKDFSLDLRI